MILIRTAFILGLLLPILTDASEVHVADTRIFVEDVAPLIRDLNKNLDIKLNPKIISDYAASIAVGNEFAESIDLAYRGLVFPVTYKIRKEETGLISLYFSSANREFASDVRDRMERVRKSSGL